MLCDVVAMGEEDAVRRCQTSLKLEGRDGRVEIMS